MTGALLIARGVLGSRARGGHRGGRARAHGGHVLGRALHALTGRGLRAQGGGRPVRVVLDPLPECARSAAPGRAPRPPPRAAHGPGGSSWRPAQAAAGFLSEQLSAVAIYAGAGRMVLAVAIVLLLIHGLRARWSLSSFRPRREILVNRIPRRRTRQARVGMIPRAQTLSQSPQASGDDVALDLEVPE